MVKVQSEPIADAVERHHLGAKTKIAAYADVSVPTLNLLIDGDAGLNLLTVDKIASFLGFDTVVSFVERPDASDRAAA